ncbi:unnamed protein product [Polarella glacialis]|uniref:Nudix hydrolase domain-containing protein n=1 Tax=Polarella glacialis TaxID=89957 RepID=A0A813FED9_POLGL|nr:unnamed protein product [Polarella glacialis]
MRPWKGDKWTYPRGKINEGENEEECAVREVWEETGVDISGQIELTQFVSADIYGSGCAMKLFIVPGISESVNASPNTRKEISKIGWIQLSRLPGWDGHSASEDTGSLRFFCVEPFVPGIRKWVKARQGGGHTAAPSAVRAPPARLPIGASAAPPGLALYGAGSPQTAIGGGFTPPSSLPPPSWGIATPKFVATPSSSSSPKLVADSAADEAKALRNAKKPMPSRFVTPTPMPMPGGSQLPKDSSAPQFVLDVGRVMREPRSCISTEVFCWR